LACLPQAQTWQKLHQNERIRSIIDSAFAGRAIEIVAIDGGPRRL
jgi:hypothetical protein